MCFLSFAPTDWLLKSAGTSDTPEDPETAETFGFVASWMCDRGAVTSELLCGTWSHLEELETLEKQVAPHRCSVGGGGCKQRFAGVVQTCSRGDCSTHSRSPWRSSTWARVQEAWKVTLLMREDGRQSRVSADELLFVVVRIRSTARSSRDESGGVPGMFSGSVVDV